MRWVEELRDKHNGEIFIFGCGPSFGKLPRDFTKGRITIGLNWVFTKFPNCTYFCMGHDNIAKAIRDDSPEFLKKCIFISYPYTKGITWPTDYNDDPIWIKWASIDGLRTPPKVARERFKKMVKEMMDPGRRENCIHFEYLTILHTAIEVAVIMGATQISLIGCDPQPRRQEFHTTSIPYYVEADKRINKHLQKIVFNLMRAGTGWLIEDFKPYGVDIRHCYFKDGVLKYNLNPYKTIGIIQND